MTKRILTVGRVIHRDRMLTKKEELAIDWHPIKNGSLCPSEITLNSHKKVWWKCKKGHEWQTSVASRNRGSKCPFCSGKYPTIDNCLKVRNSDLSREWHPTKNNSLKPEDVTPYSNKKVWWKCAFGHDWLASITNRNRGSRCPFCTGKKPTPENCLAFLLPDLAQEWHLVKNKKLTPRDVTASSSIKAWWICPYGHTWKATVANRSAGSGCPYCANQAINQDNCLARVNPLLANEWHPSKNKPLTPMDVTAVTQKSIWWRCSKGHEWQAPVYRRNLGSGCYYCSRKNPVPENCLLTKNPSLAKEWHPTKNYPLTPRDVTPSSRRMVWWACDKGHEWQDRIINRNRGTFCPFCNASSIFRELRIYTELKYIFRNVIHSGKIYGIECNVFIPHLKVGIDICTRKTYNNNRNIKAQFLKNKNVLYIRITESKGNSDLDITCPANIIDFDVVKRTIQLIAAKRDIGPFTEKRIEQYIKEGVLKNESELHHLIETIPLQMRELILPKNI